MDNRKTRRAKASAFRKELKTAKFDEFNKIDDKGMFKNNLGQFQGFWANSIYSVQIYLRGKTTLLGIRRHDQKPICPWSHKQKIKNIFMSEGRNAIEIFPSEKELTDQANMYWLWSNEAISQLVLGLGGLNKYK